MDFSLDDTQVDLRDLTAQILEAEVTVERLKELEAGDEIIDRDVWRLLAEANLLGVSLPESVGGSGYGIGELCVLLEQVGRNVAPVPLLATVGMGAMPIAQFGTDEQQQRWLPPVVAGSSLLTAAVQDPGTDFRSAPATTATADGSAWRLEGEKVGVPYATQADALLVPASTGDGSVGVFVVAPDAAGLTIEAATATNGEPQGHLALDGVVVDSDGVLGDPVAGDEVAQWMYEHALAGLCATGLGVLDRELRMTADYLSEREQFGRPIATFQAATSRAADAYIDVEAIRVTTWSAIWRLSVGRPATDELAMAKFWVADGGQRVASACQHLHGGMGADTDYPIHRYFRWAKHIELTLGGATTQLLRLGDALAAEAS